MSYPPQGNRDHEVYNSVIHDSSIFPASSANVINFVAGAVANAWSAWASIVDSPAGNALNGEFTAVHGHIADIVIETSSAVNQAYMLEIAYGTATKVRVAIIRFYGGNVPKQAVRVRGVIIPAGESLYYRMRCETGGATAEGHIRYYLEP